jgi:TIR domain
VKRSEMDEKVVEFDVALSFAGEDRAHAERLANLLRDTHVRVFYDEFVKATLWGKDLYQHLETIYKDQATYFVVFVSEAYINKNWTKHELRQAQARSFASDREYILPLRVDDAVLPGLPPTIGYLDLRNTTLEQVAVLLLETLELPTGDLGEEVARANWQGDLVEYNGTQVASFWPTIIERAQRHSMYLVSRPLGRIRWGDEKGLWPKKRGRLGPCGDCAALPGQYHAPNCDMEQCPACRGQALSCDCQLEFMSPAEIAEWIVDGALNEDDPVK